MEAIILAGGFGTRLRSVVSDVPKPMAPIAGRPFLEILLDHLLPYGFTHIVLSTGYMHEKIEAHFGNSYRGIDLSYAVETTPLGTGGGILNAFSQCQHDDVVVLNGDTLFKVDYSLLADFYRRHNTRLAIILRQVSDISRYGAVQVDCSDRVSRFVEKNSAGGMGNINGGIYMMNCTLFDGYKPGDTFSFEKDIMQKRYLDEPFYAYPDSAYFIDIGVPEDYNRLNDESKL